MQRSKTSYRPMFGTTQRLKSVPDHIWNMTAAVIGVKNMPETVPLLPIRERIKDLNTKAYYLLVALSFVYRTDSGSHLLKSVFTLTAIAAVLPIQDYIKSASWLEGFRAPKSDLFGSGSGVDGF